jgi:hypothetical protein
MQVKHGAAARLRFHQSLPDGSERLQLDLGIRQPPVEIDTPPHGPNVVEEDFRRPPIRNPPENGDALGQKPTKRRFREGCAEDLAEADADCEHGNADA